jgi:hypothetical protein
VYVTGRGARRSSQRRASEWCSAVSKRIVYARARVDAVEPLPSGLDPDPEEDETVDLGKYQAGSHERDAPPERLSEEAIRLGMMLIAPAPERDPGPAIDEEPSGAARGAHGTGEALPRTFHSGSD